MITCFGTGRGRDRSAHVSFASFLGGATMNESKAIDAVSTMLQGSAVTTCVGCGAAQVTASKTCPLKTSTTEPGLLEGFECRCGQLSREKWYHS
jgi:hypothetical protein